MAKPGVAAALAIRSKAATYTGTSPATLATGTFDVAPQSTDILVVFLAETYTEEFGPSATPAGWTLGASDVDLFLHRVAVFHRSASGFTTSNFGDATQSGQHIHAFAMSGATSMDGIAADAPDTGMNTSITGPSVSPTGSADILLEFFWSSASASAGITMPGGVTTDGTTLNGTSTEAAKSGHETLSASGATGTRTATATGTGAQEIGGAMAAVK